MIKVFPVILSHQSEEREKSPAERVKARVAVVWVPARLHTFKTIRTFPADERN